MKSSKKNKTETINSSSLKDSTDEKDGQIDKEIKQKKKYPSYFSIGCITLLLLITAFVVWIFASPDQPNLDEKDVTPAPSATPAQSTTKTKQTTVKSPPRVTTNCDGNFILPNSAALGLNTNSPGLKQNINTHYYRVYGNVAEDIQEGIRKCGPTENGNLYGAFTKYKINWVVMKYPASLGCRVQNAAVGIQIDLYYPKWEPTKDAEAGLADKWQAYHDHIVEHENVHKKDALNTAKDILKYLNSLSNIPCDLINSGVQTHLDLLKIKGEELDATTSPALEAQWFK